MAIEIARIRNVGIVGHGGVGKTSLVERCFTPPAP